MFSFIDGFKTYIAGFGLVGLGLYELSQGQMDQGWQHVAQGLGLIGLRSAMTKIGK